MADYIALRHIVIGTGRFELTDRVDRNGEQISRLITQTIETGNPVPANAIGPGELADLVARGTIAPAGSPEADAAVRRGGQP